jgi:RNA polymerase sigma-70 factor, ECF subfamily
MSAPASTLRLVPDPASSEAREPKPTPLSEAELVAGLRARDPGICDRIYRLYAREVWRMLRRILGDDPDLDDLHHEVFVQALRSAGRFRGDASLKTWLIGIAVNCARTKLRSRRRRWWLRFMAPEDLPDAESRRCDDETALHAKAVYELVDRLPTEERIAFTLRFVEGMTHGEVATAMGCSVGTVKRRVNKARARFFGLAEKHAALAALCADSSMERDD